MAASDDKAAGAGHILDPVRELIEHSGVRKLVTFRYHRIRPAAELRIQVQQAAFVRKSRQRI
jgi:hypothetical protein